jgi:hypothetical protein
MNKGLLGSHAIRTRNDAPQLDLLIESRYMYLKEFIECVGDNAQIFDSPKR